MQIKTCQLNNFNVLVMKIVWDVNSVSTSATVMERPIKISREEAFLGTNSQVLILFLKLSDFGK